MKTLTLSTLIMDILLIGCKSIGQEKIVEKHSTYNDGYYTMEVYESKDPNAINRVWFSVSVKDLKFMNPLTHWKLTSGCPDDTDIWTTDRIGFISRNFGRQQYEISCIGQNSIKTMPFTPKPNDSIVLNFVLAEYDDPEYECNEFLKQGKVLKPKD
jgi:hypothetical protein